MNILFLFDRMKDREMARRQQEVSGMTTQSNFMACKYRQVRFVINQGDLTLASLMIYLMRKS